MKKIRTLLVILLVAMFLSSGSALAFTGETEDIGGGTTHNFQIENGVLVKYSGSGGSVTIPNNVTSIGERAFDTCTNLRSVTIPNSVTSIGINAFHECFNLTQVTIPDSVTYIGDCAFWDCSMLKTVTIPDSVTCIRSGTFKYCASLRSVYIGNSVTSIDNSAFYASGLISVNIPDSVTSIETSAFSDCMSLQTAVIGSGVSIIGNKAFYRCHSLTDVIIYNAQTTIGSNAFADCNSSLVLHIPCSNTSTATWAKNNSIRFVKESHTPEVIPGIPATTTSTGLTEGSKCSVCGEILVEQTVIPMLEGPSDPDEFEIVNGVLVKYNGEGGVVIIPDGVTSIGDYAFLQCDYITSVTIPNTVTSIGTFAFYGCSNLNSVTIENREITISPEAFSDCASNLVLHLPCGISTAATWASKNKIGYVKDSHTPEVIPAVPATTTSTGLTEGSKCSVCGEILVEQTVIPMLEDPNNPDDFEIVNGVLVKYNGEGGVVIIPDDVISIGEEAFLDCSELTSVIIPYGVTHIGESAFSGCSNMSGISLPNSLESIGDYAFCACSMITNIALPDSINSIGKGAFSACNKLTSIIIPNDVQILREWAFSGCLDLKRIIIPESVVTIEDYVFQHCDSLTSISIPYSVTKIGKGSFSWCNSLTSITLNKGLTSIGSFAFFVCPSLNHVVIPDSVTALGSRAFSSCTELESIVLSSNISRIEASTFSNCTSLTDITILNGNTTVVNSAFDNGPKSLVFHTPCETPITDWARNHGYDVDPSDHVLVEEPAVPSTCVDPGMEAYWTCEVCGKMYSDAECENEIDTPIETATTEHSWGAPTYDFSDDFMTVIASRTCAVCLENETEEVETHREVLRSPADNRSGLYMIVSDPFENAAFEEQVNINTSFVIPALQNMNVLCLPENLKVIEPEAFSGIGAEAVIVSDDCESIGSRAFADCLNLIYVQFPSGIEVASDAFDGCPNVIVDGD